MPIKLVVTGSEVTLGCVYYDVTVHGHADNAPYGIKRTWVDFYSFNELFVPNMILKSTLVGLERYKIGGNEFTIPTLELKPNDEREAYSSIGKYVKHISSLPSEITEGSSLFSGFIRQWNSEKSVSVSNNGNMGGTMRIARKQPSSRFQSLKAPSMKSKSNEFLQIDPVQKQARKSPLRPHIAPRKTSMFVDSLMYIFCNSSPSLKVNTGNNDEDVKLRINTSPRPDEKETKQDMVFSPKSPAGVQRVFGPRTASMIQPRLPLQKTNRVYPDLKEKLQRKISQVALGLEKKVQVLPINITYEFETIPLNITRDPLAVENKSIFEHQDRAHTLPRKINHESQAKESLHRLSDITLPDIAIISSLSMDIKDAFSIDNDSLNNNRVSLKPSYEEFIRTLRLKLGADKTRESSSDTERSSHVESSTSELDSDKSEIYRPEDESPIALVKLDLDFDFIKTSTQKKGSPEIPTGSLSNLFQKELNSARTRLASGSNGTLNSETTRRFSSVIGNELTSALDLDLCDNDRGHAMCPFDILDGYGSYDSDDDGPVTPKHDPNTREPEVESMERIILDKTEAIISAPTKIILEKEKEKRPLLSEVSTQRRFTSQNTISLSKDGLELPSRKSSLHADAVTIIQAAHASRRIQMPDLRTQRLALERARLKYNLQSLEMKVDQILPQPLMARSETLIRTHKVFEMETLALKRSNSTNANPPISDEKKSCAETKAALTRSNTTTGKSVGLNVKTDKETDAIRANFMDTLKRGAQRRTES